MCGKKTAFLNMNVGYQPYCCFRCACDSPLKQKHTEDTNIKNRGVKCVFQDEGVKHKIKKKIRELTGYDNISKDPRTIKKIKKTKKERYGDENYNNRPKAMKTCKDLFGYEIASKSPVIKQLTEEHNIDKWGYKSTALHPVVKKKQQISLKKHLNVTTPFASKVVQEKSRKTRRERTGYNYTLQDPEMLKVVLGKKRKATGGYDSGVEKAFAKLLRSSKIRFRSHLTIFKDEETHHQFDFAIFKNDKLNCLVEIDGEYFHGLKSDCDGKFVRGDKDYIRFEIVPNNVKFLVIDSLRLKEGLQELKRILKMSYTKWKEELYKSIPKNIEDAFPAFSNKRMKKDYKKLCNYSHFHKDAFIGKSILLNYCKSRLYTISDNWDILRENLYKSPCSSHHLFERFNLFDNTCNLKVKYENKGNDIIIVKHHSPEKMLAICSSGKSYVSKEPIDKESKRIIKFLKLNAYELV